MDVTDEIAKRLNEREPGTCVVCGTRAIAEGSDPSTLCAKALDLCYKCWRTPKVREARKRELGLPGRKPKKRRRR